MAPVSPEVVQVGLVRFDDAGGVGCDRVGHRQQKMRSSRPCVSCASWAAAFRARSSLSRVEVGVVYASCHRTDFLRCGGK